MGLLSGLFGPVDKRLHGAITDPRRKYVGISIFGGYILQDWKEEQPEIPSYASELFFDLIFVGATISFTENLANNADGDHVYLYFFAFNLILTQWLKTVEYTSRLGWVGRASNNLMQLFWTIYIVCVVSTAVNSVNFLEGYNFRRVLISSIAGDTLCLIGASTLTLIPRAKNFMIFNILQNHVLHIILSIVYIFIAGESPSEGVVASYYIIHWIIFFFGKLTFLLFGKCGIVDPTNGYIPLNIEKFADRYGELFLILIGENFITIMTIGMDWSQVESYLIVGLFASTLCVLNTLYFDYKVFDVKYHAYRRSIFTSFVFNFGHTVIFLGVYGFGVGQKLAIKHYNYAATEGHRRLLAGESSDYGDSDSYSKYSTSKMYKTDINMLTFCFLIMMTGMTISWMSGQVFGELSVFLHKQAPYMICWTVVLFLIFVPYIWKDDMGLIETELVYFIALFLGLCISLFTPMRSQNPHAVYMHHEHHRENTHGGVHLQSHHCQTMSDDEETGHSEETAKGSHNKL